MSPSDNSYLKQLRLLEIERLRSYFKAGSTVLEIGAGAGWQSRYLSDLGLDVIAIDVESSNYSSQGNWNVILYDGHHLPVADHSVDIVFSSNVFEHIAHVEAFQSEIQRVLRPNGLAIHLMPSTSWRFWTSLTKYFDTMRRVSRKAYSKVVSSNNLPPATDAKTPMREISLRARLFDLFIPETHGEVGNFVTELYYFSRTRWAKLFRDTDWQIERIISNGLFYTGYSIAGDNISFSARNKLSYIFGGACWVYILRIPTDKYAAHSK